MNSYDVVETLIADGSGEITLTVDGGGGTTAITAYSLTAFPEPASLGLLGVGGLLLLKRRRAHGE